MNFEKLNEDTETEKQEYFDKKERIKKNMVPDRHFINNIEREFKGEDYDKVNKLLQSEQILKQKTNKSESKTEINQSDPNAQQKSQTQSPILKQETILVRNPSIPKLNETNENLFTNIYYQQFKDIPQYTYNENYPNTTYSTNQKIKDLTEYNPNENYPITNKNIQNDDFDKYNKQEELKLISEKIEEKPDFLKGIISAKEKENNKLLFEKNELIKYKFELENALIKQNDIIKSLKNNENNQLLSQIQTQPSQKKITTIRQKCPIIDTDDHFLSWNSNGSSQRNCYLCSEFTSCRWLCQFCDEFFCIKCIPDCIFDRKCYLGHNLVKEKLGANRGCDRCGRIDLDDEFWVDNICVLDLCIDCFDYLENTNLDNYRVEIIENVRAIFKVEFNDVEVKKIEEQNLRKTMNNIESNSFMFLTIFLMLFVPYLFLSIKIIIKLIFPFSFLRKNGFIFDCGSYYNDLLFLIKLFVLILLFLILLLPSVLVIVIQVWCLLMLDLTSEDFKITINDFSALKYLIIWIFILMICKEITKTMNSLYFVSSKFFNHGILNFITLIIVVIPLLFYFVICWYICYFNMIYIMNDESLIEVIQNFAGFFILLEFGKITLEFLKSVHFYELFDKITSTDLINISFNIGVSNFKIERTLRAILYGDSFYMEEIYPDLQKKTNFFW